MSRAISIVGVRPLGWLAACARAPSELAWRGRAQCNCVARVRGAGATRARGTGWAWECAMIVRVFTRGQANGVQTRKQLGQADGNERPDEGRGTTRKQKKPSTKPRTFSVNKSLFNKLKLAKTTKTNT